MSDRYKKFDKTMMIHAYVSSKDSYSNRRKVGACISKNGRVISTGFNGTVQGADNCCEDLCDLCKGTKIVHNEVDNQTVPCPKCKGLGIVTNEFVVHAEQNAITDAAKRGIALDGSEIFVTDSPCKTCAKLIVSVGIRRVVYAREYHCTEGIDFLKKMGLEVEHMDKSFSIEETLNIY